MNRRVAIVTALSIVGTITVAAVSFAVIYEPTDTRSTGVPLLDSALALAEASPTTPTTVVSIDASTLAPTQPDPAARVVTGPPLTAAPGDAGAAASAASGSGSGSGGRVPPPAAPSPAGATPSPAPALDPTTLTTSPPEAPTQAPATTAAPGAPGNPASPTTAAPATTGAPAPPVTTVAPRPEGVPADWPANKPIPPTPANCVNPQLEDNGVWNCQR